MGTQIPLGCYLGCTINGRAGMLENFVATTLEDFYQLPEDVTEIVQIILTLLASDLSIGKRTVE
jgi:hypothetical protein